MKRFSDVAKLMVKDMSFMKDGLLEVLVRKSKTDQLGRGAKFYLSGEKVGGVCIPEIVKRYLKGLGLKGEDMMFPRMRYSKGSVVAIKGLSVLYSSAAGQLKAEVESLGLNNISLHSGRIGGATARAVAGLNQEKLKAVGGWSSNASADLYMRMERPGIEFSAKMLQKL